MKKFRKVLSILLCLVMIAGILPVSALADDNYVAEVNGAKCKSLSDALAAASAGDAVTLLTDTQESILIDKAITLDLNGKTLTAAENDRVIDVDIEDAANGAELIIKNGKITGGNVNTGSGNFAAGGGIRFICAVYAEKTEDHYVSLSVNLKGLTIENNYALSQGGGIFIGCGNITITNCNIVNNNAKQSGGGIYQTVAAYTPTNVRTSFVASTTCHLIDSNISDNKGTGGGGVALGASRNDETASFILTDSKIQKNKSESSLETYGRGGGVYLVGTASRFTMESGSISDNDAVNGSGGGIYSANYGGIAIEGGSIVDNTAKYDGGGIALNGKNVSATIAAGCELYNNSADASGDDVYVKYYDGYQLPLTLPKTEEMSGNLILKQDNQPITDWYYDGLKNGEATPRWSEVTAEQSDGYYDIYTPVEADTAFLALKAAHEKVEEENPGSIIGTLPILWLNMEDHYSYIVGYPDGTVQPNGKITRAEVATIFFRLLSDDTREAFWSSTNSYSDVTADKWYNNAVSTLSRLGVISGYPDGTFRPDASITRAEFAKIAVSFCKYGSTTYSGCFSDVKASDWFSTCVETARNSNLIAGYPDGTFRPNNAITRAEACTIVNRTLGRKPAKNHMAISGRINWPDCLDTEWFYADMMEATNSHDYQMVGLVEDWNRKLPQRDWAALETEWSHAYSAPGGEVGR